MYFNYNNVNQFLSEEQFNLLLDFIATLSKQDLSGRSYSHTIAISNATHPTLSEEIIRLYFSKYNEKLIGRKNYSFEFKIVFPKKHQAVFSIRVSSPTLATGQDFCNLRFTKKQREYLKYLTL